MRKTLLSLLFFCFVFSLTAQHKLPSLDYVPQAPTTAAFTRYGDIPVDLSTGVPSISIPVYTLSSHGINVPISLSYHASGIKVQDVAGPVGLGWTLNAGGVITRTVLGQPDEFIEQGLTYKPRFRNAEAFSTWGQSYALSEGRFDAGWSLYNDYLNKANYDYYSDRFYYNLGNGESGIFRKDFETEVIKMIPYRPLKVNIRWADDIIEVTTTDGTLYSFKKDWDLWYLTKIINNTKTDSVMFYSHTEPISYLSFNDVSYFSAYKTMTIDRYEGELVNTNDPLCPTTMARRIQPVEQRFPGASTTWNEVVLLDSIVSSDAAVRFSYLTDRNDYRLFGQQTDVGSPKSRLAKIQVFSKSTNVVVKEMNFTQSYFGDQVDHLTRRLRLDDVRVGANQEEKYSFKYHGSWLPPYSTSINGFNEDFWGYYNGSASNITMLSNEFTPSGVSNLFPDEESAKACTLEEIQYPTGGKTVFEFESNRVNRDIYGFGFTSPLVPADGKVGGLRVKKIASYAYEGATPLVKQYNYEIHGNGYYYRELNSTKFAYLQNVFYDFFVSYAGTACGMNSNYFFTTRNVCYARPSGYVIGTSEAPLVYDKVTEFNGDENINTGKTIYYYEGPDFISEHFGDEPRFQGPYWRDRGNYEPSLGTKEEYKNENGIYKLVRKTVTERTAIQESTFSTGFNLESDMEFISLSGPSSDAFNKYNNDPSNFGLGEYYYNTMHFSDCKGFTALYVPSKTEVYDYVDANNYFKTTTSYENNQYGQQIAATTITSKGDAITTKFTYPVDYPTQAPYNTMIEKNILAPVIEQSTFKNNTNFLQSTKNNYDYWDGSTQTWGNSSANQILPRFVETKKGANAPETRLQFFTYDDKGNPVYVAKENDVHHLYIWGYNKTYPVAHVVNVPESERPYVAYTSFEENNTGNWILTGNNNIIVNQTAPTGNLVFLLGNNGLSRSISPTTTYILSYWYKDGHVVNVSGNSILLTSSAPKNGWIYVKKKITGVSTVSITGIGQIDEVRLYPESAQMVTVAYNPLVGIMAQCDVNDRITYYNYDASGRLTLIKDDNGNVLKKICYNYQGQTEDCGTNATPLWQATGATRCKACPANNNYITNIQQREERDNNASSDTYGNTRWMDVGVSGSCVIQADWQFTGNPRCITLNNQNTGEQERLKIDVNPCSGSYGQTYWASAGTNTTACPLPPSFRSAAINKNYLKQNCGSQQIPVPYPVSIPEGAYTSANNAAEANALAEAEAQRQANVSGGCTTIYVRRIRIDENTGDPSYEQADIYFRFYSDAAGTIETTLPSEMTVNYQWRNYDMENGVITSDSYGGSLPWALPAGATQASFENTQTMTFDGTTYHYVDILLLPGRYVIIP